MNHDFSIFFKMESLIVFILVLSRISGMIGAAPLFSTFPIPMQVKAALSVISAFIMYPLIIQHTQFPIPHDLLTMALMIFKELFIGILIGFCAELIFVGIQIGGQLLSTQMGLAVANALDPVTKQNVPIVGQFYLYLASIIFIYLNGHHWLFTSVYNSYTAIPIGMDFAFTQALGEKIIVFTSQLFVIAFQIIMPIFGILFITDVALAFVSKVMPQMNVFMVSIPLKIYIGLAAMSLFLSTTAVYTSSLIENTLDNLRSIFM